MSPCRSTTSLLACFDDGATKVTLQHVTVYNALGVAIAAYYADETGAIVDTSAGVATLGACSITPPDVETTQLCDMQPDGTSVEFIRRVVTTFDASGLVSGVVVTDWELDQVTAYVPTGTVTRCSECPADAVPLGLITSAAPLTAVTY